MADTTDLSQLGAALWPLMLRWPARHWPVAARVVEQHESRSGGGNAANAVGTTFGAADRHASSKAARPASSSHLAPL
jgi:hypothetical protein